MELAQSITRSWDSFFLCIDTHKEVLLSIYSYWIVVFPKTKGYAKRSSNTSDVVHPKSKPKEPSR